LLQSCIPYCLYNTGVIVKDGMHSFIPPDRFFPYLTWTEIQQMPDKDNVVLLQPVGAIEQHGPHLPLVVDAAIATAVLGKALERLEPDIPAYVLPTLCYGKSNEHWHFPGTVTLSAQTLIATLMEVGESLYRAGFRKLALVNGHGGQPQIMEIVARDLHQRYEDFMVFPLFVWRVPNLPIDLLTPKEAELGIHAGDAETSLLLSILPDQVRMEQAVTEYPQELPQASVLSMEGKLPFAWATRDLSQSGVLGDPTVATKEKGDRFLDALATGWVQAIQDIYRFQQPKAWKKI
jgi:creatinine amidohydrolase